MGAIANAADQRHHILAARKAPLPPGTIPLPRRRQSKTGMGEGSRWEKDISRNSARPGNRFDETRSALPSRRHDLRRRLAHAKRSRATPLDLPRCGRSFVFFRSRQKASIFRVKNLLLISIVVQVHLCFWLNSPKITRMQADYKPSSKRGSKKSATYGLSKPI